MIIISRFIAPEKVWLPVSTIRSPPTSRQADPALTVGAILGRQQYHEGIFTLPVDVLSVEESLVDADFMAAAREAGKQVHVWTVNEPADMRRLIDLGVDAVITNYPDRFHRSAGRNNVTAASTDISDRRTIMGFTIGYWMLNVIEMFERLAYYSVRSVVALYIMQADDPHGLHFTAADKGTIYAFWFGFQSILPTFTGGFADRYGYKKSLFVSITLNIIGYIMMGTLTSYTGFLLGVIVLATGTAFFKPCIQGSLAHNLTKKNSSMGWGIFYWIVNVGAASAPVLANFIRTDISWQALFFTAAGIMSLNYLMLFTFKDFESGADKSQGPLKVLVKTLRNLGDMRLVTWLLIMSCFWLMMYALWDLQPNFVTDWNDSERRGAAGSTRWASCRTAGPWKPIAVSRCRRSC